MARNKVLAKKKATASTGSAGGTVIRRSVSLERDVDALAHQLVGDANFSAFVNEAMREKTQRIQMLRLLDDLDAEFGEIGNDIKDKAEALWQTASRSTRARS